MVKNLKPKQSDKPMNNLSVDTSTKNKDPVYSNNEPIKKSKTKSGLQPDKGIIKQNHFSPSNSNQIENSPDCNTFKFNSEFYEESGRHDNTPKSLKKSKKRKKKKTNQLSEEDCKRNILAGIEYLNKWKNDRNNWKFEKVRQIRLISNMFNEEKLPEKTFPIFVEYMHGASESTKKLITAKANEVITEMEKWCSLTEEEQAKTNKVDENKYERARTLIQFLE